MPTSSTLLCEQKDIYPRRKRPTQSNNFCNTPLYSDRKKKLTFHIAASKALVHSKLMVSDINNGDMEYLNYGTKSDSGTLRKRPEIILS
ncbi:hypothetical protein EMCRGX_G006508 [Ephydatia muelleri]